MTDLVIDGKTDAHISGGAYDRVIIRRSQRVRLENVEVRFQPTATTVAHNSAIEVTNSSDVDLSGLKIIGGLSVDGLNLPCARAITVTACQDVAIIGGQITGFDRQVVLGKLDRALISGLLMRGRRRTALVGSNLNDVTIEYLDVDGASPQNWGLLGGDHADCLALWSDAVQGPNTGVRIRHNMLMQSAGAAILGMWLQGKKAETPFLRCEVTDNWIAVPNLQGALFNHTRESIVARNTFLRIDVPGSPVKQRPTILLREGCVANEISDNRVSAPISDTSKGGNVQRGNVLLKGVYSL